MSEAVVRAGSTAAAGNRPAPVASRAVASGDAMAGSAFRFPLDVRFFEVDSLGVVFNMWYLGWCDEAMSAFMESIGYGYATLRAGGLDAVLRKAELEWLDSLQAFQHVEVEVRVDQVGTTSFRLSYSIERVDEAGAPDARGAPCALATITYVCVGIEGRSTTPIPAGLREALVTGHPSRN
jgi:acyl-CoA thioester hydrolase